MIKATAGGGGMGLQVCRDLNALRTGFAQVKSRGNSLFQNSSMFLEIYVESGRQGSLPRLANHADALSLDISKYRYSVMEVVTLYSWENESAQFRGATRRLLKRHQVHSCSRIPHFGKS